MRLIFLSLLLITQTLMGKPSSSEKSKMLATITSYKGPKTFLLSYPRSGNTWMRYSLEYNTLRPTFHTYHVDPRNQPLAWLAGFEIDYTKPPIEKIHEKKDFDTDVDQLILLVRNPKETIKRAEHTISKNILISKGKLYFDNIALFDSWNPQKRILIYYEDFLTDPKATLERLLDFLNEPPTRLEDFLKDYEHHQKKAIEIYKESLTKAKDLLQHSRKMPEALRKQIDLWIEELYPIQWNKYIKHRFSEEVLDYNSTKSLIFFFEEEDSDILE